MFTLAFVAILTTVASTIAADEVRIVSPSAGATVSGPEVAITLDVGSLQLIPGAQATRREDLHVHYLLDIDPTPWLDGTRDLPTGDPNIVHSAAPSHTFQNLAPGQHRVTVILTDANHIAIQPVVAPAVSFTVSDDVAWTSKANMPTARYDLGVAESNGSIYAIGGFDGTQRLATLEIYDPASNTWTTKTSMPTARHDFGVATASNGKIYVVGGFDGANRLATVEEYDPATDTWTTKASMPTARSALGVVAAGNGKLYAIGGCRGSLCERLATVEEYDPATDTWTTKASMPTARSALGVVAASNGKIYAIGGCQEQLCERIATVEEYDPTTNTWTTRASMPTPRDAFGVAERNGKIYVVGGFDGANRLAIVEEYNLATNTWTTRTSMPTARSGLGVIAFGRDKIYAIGGYGGGAGTVEEAVVPTGATPTQPTGTAQKPAATSGSSASSTPRADAVATAAPPASTVDHPHIDTAEIPLVLIALGVAVIAGATIVGVAFVLTRQRAAASPGASSPPTPSPSPYPSPAPPHSGWPNPSPAPPATPYPNPSPVPASTPYPNSSPPPASSPWSAPSPPGAWWPSPPPVNVQAGSASPTVPAWNPNAFGPDGQGLLAGYQIVGPPKQGGMASVYKAYQPALDRYVALKVMLPHLASDPNFVQRFYDEARRTARLDHPNIVTIHDIGQLPSGSLFITMRYIEGICLHDMLARERSLAIGRATLIAIEVAKALEYAHQRGIIHRDVKPSNIMIENGDRVTLTDFGIAKLLGDMQLTRPGAVVGTPKYLSPEQASGEPVDHRSDIYALGLVLYEMLAGRAPFEFEAPAALLHAHISQPPRLPTEFNAEIPTAVEAVVLKTLEKDPTRRYQSAGELAQALAHTTAERRS